MKVIKTDIEDVVILQPDVFGDNRGYFMESWSQPRFDEAVRPVRFVQDNESKSRYGVLRGLHYQKGRYSQSKLVRVVKGRVLDVAVDIRRGSAVMLPLNLPRITIISSLFPAALLTVFQYLARRPSSSTSAIIFTPPSRRVPSRGMIQ